MALIIGESVRDVCEDAAGSGRKRSCVHVTLTRATTSDQPIENATIVAEEMLRWLDDIDGFEGFLMLSREGTSVGLSFWESREVAEQHRVARMEFIGRMTSAAGVEVQEIVDYDVTFARLGPLAIDSTT
jgi:hypothetical protein